MKKIKETYFSESIFIKILLIWVIIVCMIPNVWLSITENMSGIQSLTNIILPCGFYLMLMSITRHIGRATLWMTILFVFAAFQIVLLHLYGRSIISVDMFLNVTTTNPQEAGDMLDNMPGTIGVIVLLYLPPIVMGIIAAMRHWRLKANEIQLQRKVASIIVVVGLSLFFLSFKSERKYRPVCDLYPLNVVSNLGTAIHRTILVSHYHETSAGFTYNAKSTRPKDLPELYILIIGETSRADNWQIAGYHRPTTPRLMNINGLTFFDKALTESNTTHKSVPMLLSGLDARSFGDSIYKVKGIITAFNEAQFKTSFFSAQSRNHSFIDFFGEEADSCIFIKDDDRLQKTYFDEDLLPYLDEELAKGNTKQLIVLHTYGSHFNYIGRYPEEEAQFIPDRPLNEEFEYRQKLLNAYDNTILYTSNFIADVIERIKDFPGYSAVIYTSDHGEDIFDDPRHLFAHASPIPSYYQLHVPFLIWINDTFVSENPSISSCLKENSGKFVSSSKSFFHTALELAGLSSPFLSNTASVANRNYRNNNALFLNDHNESINLSDCGILTSDIKRLESLSCP